MGAYVNIIAPDGTPGRVPQENMKAALDAGGKIGIHVYAPDGTPGLVPHDQLPAAIKAGATAIPGVPLPTPGHYVTPPMPTDQSQPQENTFQRNFDQSTQTSPNDSLPLTFVKTLGAGLGAPIAHPKQFAGSVVQSMLLPGSDLGTPPDPIAPIVNDYKTGGAAYAGTKTAGNLASMLLMGKLGSAVMGAAAPSEMDAALSPEEMSARQITKAVNPAAPAYQQYLDAAENQIGNVLDYAKNNNIAISANGNKGVGASLAKVAGMAKDEASQHYENNVLGPHEDVRPGGVSQGPLAGTDPNLRQIDSRLQDIAAEQQSPNRQPTPGQVMGRSDLELVNEKAHLSDILHQSLGDLTQMGAGDVQGLRQRIAQLGVLSGETQGAANAVTRSAGIQDTGAGSGIPAPTTHGVLSHVLSNIPGFDPESLQGKAILKALGNTPIQGNALPTPFSNTPMAETPTVTAYQQNLARLAAQSANDISDQSGVQQAKANAAVQRQQQAAAASKALQDQFTNRIAKSKSQSQYRRFIDAPDIGAPQ